MKRKIYLLMTAVLFLAGSRIQGQDIPMTLEAGMEEMAAPGGAPLADGQSKFLGCAWSYGQATNFEKYWNQITPENAGKWGSVEYVRNQMNWTVLDSTYNVARRNNMPFKLHTLIWGAQQPPWMGSLDSATQRQEIEQWFSLLAARYDSFASIDVVNEPIHNAPNGMLPWGSTTPNINYAQALGGAGQTGWDWIITSFRLARQYFPKAKLILNEYSVINSTSTTQQYLEIINLLKAENLIDGIGEQAHAFTTYGTSTTTLKANLDALGATGLPIYLTELDIDGTTDLIQLREYQRIFPLFWEHPSIQGITLWGFRYGLWRTDQGAYLINQAGQERTAMTWLKAYVNDTLTLMESLEVKGNNTPDTIFVDETLQLSAVVAPYNTTIPKVTWSVTPSILATISSNGLLMPVADGIVTVKAVAWDGSGVQDTHSVVILDHMVESVTVSSIGSIDTIVVGATLQMGAEVLPENATNSNVTWSVTPAGKASITQGGLLTAIDSGVVSVKATAKDGSGVSDTMAIVINEVLAESITLSSADDLDTITLAETLQLSATVLPANTTNSDVVWSVIPEEIADINAAGLLTAIAAGEVTVTATSTDGSGVSGSMDITIENLPTGIKNNLQDQDLQVFPNPTMDGKFTLQGLESISLIEIIDITGRKIKEVSTLNEKSIDIHMEALPGIYLIKLSNDRLSVYKRLVVK